MSNTLDESFIFNQIRNYNRAQRQTDKDKALLAVALHTGLLGEKAVLGEPNQNQRQVIINFLNQFCRERGVNVTIQ